ncbi:MAG TPA: hypothetical protein VHE12_14140 [bacterium]|nr:hypothetical protein [bacterium]
MEIFSVLQIVFDAVLLFGLLFVFHYSVNQSQKKGEEAQIVKDLQVDEIRGNLQELLMTLKQLGKEVSENLQEQVRDAEAKTEKLKKMVTKLDKDLEKVLRLSEAVDQERDHLQEKEALLKASKKSKGSPRTTREVEDLAVRSLPNPRNQTVDASETVLDGFSVGGGSFSPKVLKEVYRLADTKSDLSDIAHKTKLSRAEVQLILNLRGNRFSTPN